ncbi:hypothetical protein DICPUDRAFT_77723 [Dictyostelium purpureum]|uniref:START domain-containing protein n=1 Tax=Dictyostelium purpureum TaxID=5786 RepID=F0ZHF6_DICPU|nr:uncharacterized protein DICPUDRAFT_77723 [Dictyostelium purpureum]EGC36606.1 hypothetical protein DICPUDRAFT_77723 [Dictyostelium purpureum]|eukprot:XP_003286844.1 hypothetical protein DICPUDRAFT_77723 [Dictyostelium purpureum]
MMSSSDTFIKNNEENNQSLIINIDDIANQYNEVLELCNLDKIKLAGQKLVSLELLIDEISKDLDESNVELNKIIETIRNDVRLKKLKQESLEIDDLLLMLSSDYLSQGWQSIHNSNGIHSMYKENGSGMHSIRIEGIIESPIFDVCSVIMEADLYSSWIPRMLCSQILYQDSRYKRLLYCKASCPWPVANRDVCLYGYGVDMLEEEDLVVVVSRTIKEEDLIDIKLTSDIPTPKDGTVRADAKISGFTIKPISKDKTYVQVVSLTDPCMQLIPYWLLNFVINQFCHYLFVMLRKQSNKVSTDKEYQTRIKSNPIYKDIWEKAEKYFEKVNNNNDNNK